MPLMAYFGLAIVSEKYFTLAYKPRYISWLKMGAVSGSNSSNHRNGGFGVIRLDQIQQYSARPSNIRLQDAFVFQCSKLAKLNCMIILLNS
jgi:hypothetical protein